MAYILDSYGETNQTNISKEYIGTDQIANSYPGRNRFYSTDLSNWIGDAANMICFYVLGIVKGGG